MTARRRGAQAFILLLGAVCAAALIANEVTRTTDLRRRILDAAHASLTADTCALQGRLEEVHLLLLLISHDPDVSRFDPQAPRRVQTLLDSSRAAAALARLYIVRRSFDGREPFLEIRTRDAPGPIAVSPPADQDAEVYGTLHEQVATFVEHPRLPALLSFEIDMRATPGRPASVERAVVFAVPIRSAGGDLTGVAAAAIPSDHIRAVISARDDRVATLLMRPGGEPLAAGDVSPARARWLESQLPPDGAPRSEQLRALPDALGPAVSIWRPIAVAGAKAGWVARIIDPGRGGWRSAPVSGLLGGGAVFALAVALALMLRHAGRRHDAQARMDTVPAHAEKTEPVAVLTREVAHDVNNILATILTIGRWLESQIGPDDPSMESVREIVAAARRGGALTRRLLGGRDPGQDRVSSVPAASQESTIQGGPPGAMTSAVNSSACGAPLRPPCPPRSGPAKPDPERLRHATNAARIPPEQLRQESTLLIVDDEAPLRGVVRAAFERSGYRVLEARDGEEALATFDAGARTIDCVLLDVELPTIDGRECLERLRARAPRLPVVMVTGQVLGDEAGSLVAAGAHAVLAKPFEVEELVGVVQEALQSARRTHRKER